MREVFSYLLNSQLAGTLQPLFPQKEYAALSVLRRGRLRNVAAVAVAAVAAAAVVAAVVVDRRHQVRAGVGVQVIGVGGGDGGGRLSERTKIDGESFHMWESI